MICPKEDEFFMFCEGCRKKISSKVAFVSYGPDTVQWGDDEKPKIHWHCCEDCKKEND